MSRARRCARSRRSPGRCRTPGTCRHPRPPPAGAPARGPSSPCRSRRCPRRPARSRVRPARTVRGRGHGPGRDRRGSHRVRGRPGVAYDVLLDGLGCTRPGQGCTASTPNCATSAGESAPAARRRARQPSALPRPRRGRQFCRPVIVLSREPRPCRGVRSAGPGRAAGPAWGAVRRTRPRRRTALGPELTGSRDGPAPPGACPRARAAACRSGSARRTDRGRRPRRRPGRAPRGRPRPGTGPRCGR